MYIKLLVSFIGGCLLTQLVSAEVITKLSGNDSSEEVNPRQFYNSILEDFNVISKFIVSNGKVFFHDVLKDVDKFETKSDFLQSNFTAMSSFLKEADKYGENSTETLKVFLLAEEFINIMTVFKKAKMREEDNKDSEEFKILSKILKEHGEEKFENDVGDRYLELISKLTNKFEEYVNKLSPEGKEKEAKYLKWYDNFKGNEFSEEPFHAFSRFFIMYNDEEE